MNPPPIGLLLRTLLISQEPNRQVKQPAETTLQPTAMLLTADFVALINGSVALGFLFIWAEVYGYHSENTADVSMGYCPRTKHCSRGSQQMGKAGDGAASQRSLCALTGTLRAREVQLLDSGRTARRDQNWSQNHVLLPPAELVGLPGV